MNLSFTRKNRIRKSYFFGQVYKKGTKFTGKYVILYLLKTDSPVSQMGLSVSKRRGPAFKRNLIKRWIRESFRLSQESFSCGFMAVFVARSKVADKSTSFAEVDKEIKGLLFKAGVYEADKWFFYFCFYRSGSSL